MLGENSIELELRWIFPILLSQVSSFIGHNQKNYSSELFQLQNSVGNWFKAAMPWLRAENNEVPEGILEATTNIALANSDTFSDKSFFGNKSYSGEGYQHQSPRNQLCAPPPRNRHEYSQ